MRALSISLMLIASLTACGGTPESSPQNNGLGSVFTGADPEGGDAAPEPSPTVAQGTAAAENIDCRNRRPAVGSVNDVMGVSMGMDAQEAYARLACANPAFTVAFSTSGGFTIESLPGAADPRKLITADAGTEKVVAYLVGKPGLEKVYVVSRQVEFGEGNEPPVQTLYQTLAAKYGKGVQHAEYTGPIITIAHSPTGELMGPESQTLRQCWGNPRSSSVSVSEACGLVVDYEVEPKKSNTGLAARLFLTIADQRAAMQAIKSFKALVQANVEGRRAEELRQAREATDKAGADNIRVPTL